MIHTRPNEGLTNEWLTPPAIIEKLGPFDLDPCSPEIRPWPTALLHYTKKDDGLEMPWQGFVWCNPPYGNETWKWLERLGEHGNGIALVFARTEVEGFHRTVWERATSIHFFEGRLYFHNLDGSRARGNAGGGSVLVAYGKEAHRRVAEAGFPGRMVTL